MGQDRQEQGEGNADEGAHYAELVNVSWLLHWKTP